MTLTIDDEFPSLVGKDDGQRQPADINLNDRTIKKYRNLAIEFEEFLDTSDVQSGQKYREIFDITLSTLKDHSTDQEAKKEATDSMTTLLKTYLMSLKSPDGRQYGASSYCVRRSAIRWHVDREYHYEMSRIHNWNGIFKVPEGTVINPIRIHGIRNSYSGEKTYHDFHEKRLKLDNELLPTMVQAAIPPSSILPSYSQAAPIPSPLKKDESVLQQILTNQQTILENQSKILNQVSSMDSRLRSLEKKIPKIMSRKARLSSVQSRGIMTVKWTKVKVAKRKSKK